MAIKRKTNRLKKYQEAGFVFDPKKLLPVGEFDMSPVGPPPITPPLAPPKTAPVGLPSYMQQGFNKLEDRRDEYVQQQVQRQNRGLDPNLALLPMYARTAASAIGTNIANNRQNEYLWRNLANPYMGILPYNEGRSEDVTYGYNVAQFGGEIERMRKGGKQPSPAKAEEILHNPPHGQPLTDKQRKYFGWLSNQKKQYGGMQDFILDDDEEDEDEVSSPATPSEEVTAPSEEEIQEQVAEQARQQRRYSNREYAMRNLQAEPSFDMERMQSSSMQAFYPPVQATPRPSNENAKFAFQHLQSRGLQPHAAAGIVGNLMQESGLNPHAKGDAGKATGIAQWHPDRFRNLTSWAKKQGRNPYELTTQLDFILEENDPVAGNIGAKLNAAPSVEHATSIFSQLYERPGKPEIHKRVGYAKGLFNYQTGGTYNISPEQYFSMLQAGYNMDLMD